MYIIATILIILIGFRGYKFFSEKTAQKNNFMPPEASVIQAAPAVTTDLIDSVELTGSVQPILKTTFSSKIMARVKEAYVNEGDKVEQGKLLLLMDDSDLVAQEKQAIANIAASKARLQQTVSRSPITEAQTKTTLDQAKANLSSAQSSYDTAKRNLERQQNLMKEGYISQQMLDTAENQYQMARSQLIAAKSALDSAKANTAQNQIQAEDVVALSSQLQQAEASLEYIKTQIQQTRIIAPYSGFITGRFVDPGAMATSGLQLLSIADLDTVWIEILVPEEYLNKISLGDTVKVAFDALDNKTFTGKIVQINPSGDPRNLSYKVRISITNQEHMLKAGMFARADLILEKHKNVVAVPKDAVFEDKGKKWVFVVNGDKVHLREITTGFSDSQMTEIKSGAAAGENVATLISPNLKDGDTVKIEKGEKGLKY
ncbi:MAG: efflux RND transporter periplasmic adaptor subunit [Firmicutes bacterium]|nr:efflux RND transporter periplasmic adaptor subunit [Bacillota bacterium]